MSLGALVGQWRLVLRSLPLWDFSCSSPFRLGTAWSLEWSLRDPSGHGRVDAGETELGQMLW